MCSSDTVQFSTTVCTSGTMCCLALLELSGGGCRQYLNQLSKDVAILGVAVLCKFRLVVNFTKLLTALQPSGNVYTKCLLGHMITTDSPE